MNKLSIAKPAERVDHLEQECGRLTRSKQLWKRLGGSFVAILATVLVLGADGGKVIEAERFILRGKDKQELIRLEEIPGQGPSLTFFDLKGKQRINLMLEADGKASMGFFDRDEGPHRGERGWDSM